MNVVLCVDGERAVLKSIRLTLRDNSAAAAPSAPPPPASAAAAARRPVKMMKRAGNSKAEQPV